MENFFPNPDNRTDNISEKHQQQRDNFAEQFYHKLDEKPENRVNGTNNPQNSQNNFDYNIFCIFNRIENPAEIIAYFRNGIEFQQKIFRAITGISGPAVAKIARCQHRDKKQRNAQRCQQ